MATTIKIEKETRKKLLSLDLAEKGKSFNIILNELISYYEKNNKDYKKTIKDYNKQMQEYKKFMEIHKKEMQKVESEKDMWKRLLKWAKSKGFKG